VAQRDALLGLGALDVTDSREQLCATVLEVLGRSPPSADEPQR
jgi:hypothetical protein